MQTLSGKTVVITGAGSGIGRALAVQASNEGARLALSDIDLDGLAETKRLCSGSDVRTDRLDVADRAAWSDYASAIAEHYGTVNVVINNAGVALSSNIVDMSYDDFDWLMGINFWGVVHGTKAFLPHLIASGDGYVVNISSLYGLMSVPSQAAYNSAKFGVRGFTEALRMEMKLAEHRVGVTCVHPGGIKTAIARNARGDAFHDAAELAAHFDEALARTTPEKAARTIWGAVRRRKARVLVGPDAKLLDLVVRALGSGYQRVLLRTLAKPDDTVGAPRLDVAAPSGSARSTTGGKSTAIGTVRSTTGREMTTAGGAGSTGGKETAGEGGAG